MNKKSLPLSLAYFIAIAIDAIGFTIVGPILVPLVNHLVDKSGLAQHLLYGFILSIYSLSFMLGAPILGALSDFLGRRKVLIIASFGVLTGYICYALSLEAGSLILLIIGRVLTGFCAASQCIAQAAMIDISQNNNRINNIGLIASAMTAGLIVGPLASLALSTQNLNLTSLRIPFYAITTALTLNLVYLILFLKESHHFEVINQEIKRIKHQSQQFINQFKQRKISQLFLAFFLFELGWSLYYQSLAIELPLNLKLNPQDLALFFSFIGISLTAALLILVRISSHYFKPIQLNRFALLIGIMSLSAQFFCKSLVSYYLLGLSITSVVALVYTGLIAELSQQSETKNQGLLMGTSDAILALAFTSTGLLAGFLSFLFAGLPLLTAAIFWLSAFVCLSL